MDSVGFYQIQVVFPDIPSREMVETVVLWTFQSEEEACEVLLDGRLHTGDLTLYNKVSISGTTENEPWELVNIPAGEVLFYVQGLRQGNCYCIPVNKWLSVRGEY